MPDVTEVTRELDDRFLDIHRRKERAFWNTRMGIRDEGDVVAQAEIELKSFLGDIRTLERLRVLQSSAEHGGDGDESSVLHGWIRTLEQNAIESSEGRKLYEANVEAERDLVRARGGMRLGFVEPSTGRFTRATSVALSNGLMTGSNEAFRRACHDGLRSVQDFVLENGYLEVVKLRNRFARAEGYADFFEYKLQKSEGFGKETAFALLDELEAGTREKARQVLADLAERHGDAAIAPWNLNFHAGGSLAGDRDPYYLFEDALERWMRAFDAMGIRFAGARLTLDLVERQGKYENGFMHGPAPAFLRDGTWHAATINFAANAIPNRVGSGQRAAQTLFHEGGHAAHFANIRQPSPCFSHESAISPSLAETQAMFADSVLSTGEWQARYARDAGGRRMPIELIEKVIRRSRPFLAQGFRAMLAICYAERAIYELPDDEVSADRVSEICRDVEARLAQTPGGAPRPILSIPHVLSWDSSAYYQSYVMARMAVRQTRDHFLDRYGRIVDEPRVGEDLSRVYWEPGSARPFLDLVKEMTGSALSAAPLVAASVKETEEAVREMHESYARTAESPEPDGDPDLDMRLRITHGTEVVVEEGTSFAEAVERFRSWVRAGWPREAAS